MRDNEQLSRLVQEQEVRMEELERQAERAAEDDQDRLQILEDVQSDKATISRALTQNRDLKNQLAELQNGFVKLVSASSDTRLVYVRGWTWPLTSVLLQTNENMELTSALQSEQHIKKEIARKIGQLQEDLHNAKEQVCVRAELTGDAVVLKQGRWRANDYIQWKNDKSWYSLYGYQMKAKHECEIWWWVHSK